MNLEATNDTYYPGLEGVIANETSIANVEGKDGDGGLEYRGYRIEDLAEHVSYEETAYLLLRGELPNRTQLREFESRLRQNRLIPEPLVELMRTIPDTVHPMDVLRTSVSVLSHFDPERQTPPTDHDANLRKAERVLARMATAVAYRERIAKGLTLVPPRDDLDHAANFLFMVSGKVPSEAMRKAFDLSLVLYAEHELNASTFAGRVTVSTLSDLYSGLVQRWGRSRGHCTAAPTKRHGRSSTGRLARERRALDRRRPGPQRADHGLWPQGLQDRRSRARILKDHCQAIAREVGEDRWEQIAEPIEKAVTEKKHLPPNVDWPSARLYHYMGLDIEIYTPIFAIAARCGLVGSYHRAARAQQAHAAAGSICRSAQPAGPADLRARLAQRLEPARERLAPARLANRVSRRKRRQWVGLGCSERQPPPRHVPPVPAL